MDKFGKTERVNMQKRSLLSPLLLLLILGFMLLLVSLVFRKSLGKRKKKVATSWDEHEEFAFCYSMIFCWPKEVNFVL